MEVLGLSLSLVKEYRSRKRQEEGKWAWNRDGTHWGKGTNHAAVERAVKWQFRGARQETNTEAPVCGFGGWAKGEERTSR